MMIVFVGAVPLLVAVPLWRRLPPAARTEIASAVRSLRLRTGTYSLRLVMEGMTDTMLASVLPNVITLGTYDFVTLGSTLASMVSVIPSITRRRLYVPVRSRRLRTADAISVRAAGGSRRHKGTATSSGTAPTNTIIIRESTGSSNHWVSNEHHDHRCSPRPLH